jgi:signal transduction histidine kinase
LVYPVSVISDDDIEHYFYPFTVDYSSVKNQGESDPLDVSIPKVVIHKHGGTVQVAKENGRRVILTISLPVS